MKKIIKYILYQAYNILLNIFLAYLIIYYLCRLDKETPAYTYLLVLLLGMILGVALYRKDSQLLYHYEQQQQQKRKEQEERMEKQKEIWKRMKDFFNF